MKYYQFKSNGDCIGSPPMDENGNEIHNWLWGHSDHAVDRALVTVDLPKQALPDAIFLGSYYLFSPKLMDCIKRAELEFDLLWLPTRVESGYGELLAEYVLPYHRTEYAVLDVEKSTAKWTDNKKNHALEVYEWAILDEAIPRFDLFREATSDEWIATESFAAICKKNRITGCMLEFIWESHDESNELKSSS